MQLEAYDFLPEDAKRIREAVFMKEQGFKNEFDDIDLLALHLILYDGSQPAATCRLFPAAEQGVYLLGRLAVVKTYRGQKLGQRMLREARSHRSPQRRGRTSAARPVPSQPLLHTGGLHPLWCRG